MRARTKLAAMVAVLLVTRQAYGDAADAPSPTHMHSPRIACREADPTSCIRLREGWYLDEPGYTALDVEMKRLQDAETRLTAENTSLRSTASGWSPGWRTIAAALVVGIGLGIYVDHKL